MEDCEFINPCCEPLCCESPTIGFCFRKIDAVTSRGLAGATFELRKGDNIIATGISDARGQVLLQGIHSGTYTLHETLVPAGYRPNPTIYQVVIVSKKCIKINGTMVPFVAIANIPETLPSISS